MRARRRRGVGIGLMVASMLGAASLAVPAMAQDADEPTEVEVEVQRLGLFTYPLNDAIPDTLLEQFPPQVICVLFPEFCNDQTAPVRDPITGVVRDIDDLDQTSPLQPVQPDTLTVRYLGGVPQYISAIDFVLPEVPAGEELDQLTLVLDQTPPTYAFDSPAFRRAVLAMIQFAGSQDPAVFQEGMQAALAEEPASQPELGIEACPLVVDIPEGAEPPQSKPASELNVEGPDGPDGAPQLGVDCLYGSNGVFDAEAETWSFDLTFAAQAWADGILENRGVLLRPVGAPNLAFGDPDTSTNAQVSLDAAAPKVLVASSEPPPPPPPFEPVTPPPATTGTAPPPPPSNPPSSSLFTAPPPMASGDFEAVPPAEVAPQTPTPQQTPAPQSLDTVPVATPSQGPWVWLLVPAFLLGAWLVARSLTEELAVATARPGALSRLVAGELA